MDTAPCVGCGMCCDGTLYSLVKAEPAEEQRIIEHGLSIRDQDGKRYFELPCLHCRDGRCGIYEERFAKCRSFSCKLLTAYQSGDTGVDIALQTVQIALRLRREAIAVHPDAATSVGRTRLRAEFGNSKEHRDLILRIAALDYFLDFHFRNKNLQVTPEQRA